MALGSLEDDLVITRAGHRRGRHQANAPIAILRLQQAAHLAAEEVGGGVRIAKLHNRDRRTTGALELVGQYAEVAVALAQGFFGGRIDRLGRCVDCRHRTAARQRADQQDQAQNVVQSAHQCPVTVRPGKAIIDKICSAISFCPVIVK
ncbi:hypothetical protein D3C77_312690 [compost metagenome]